MTTPADTSDDRPAFSVSDVSIDSDGRVVINSPELAAALQEQMKEEVAPRGISVNWKCKPDK
jgi:hypothetical protein